MANLTKPRFEILAERLVQRFRVERLSNAANLEQLARSFGARDIQYKFGGTHGATAWTPRGPIVFVRMGESDGRRRANLSHECMHLILDPVFDPEALFRWDRDAASVARSRSLEVLGSRIDQLSDAIESAGLEYACDHLAYEVLFPRRSAIEIARSPVDLEQLISIAKSWRVSLSLAAIRLFRAGRNSTLLRLRRLSSRDWLVADSIGSRDGPREGSQVSVQPLAPDSQVGSTRERSRISWRGIGAGSIEVDSRLREDRGLVYVDWGSNAVRWSSSPAGTSTSQIHRAESK